MQIQMQIQIQIQVQMQIQIKSFRDVERSGKDFEACDARDACEQHQEEHCRSCRGMLMLMMMKKMHI